MDHEPPFSPEKYDEALDLVAPWDFDLTIRKLQEPAYAGWSEQRARAAERDYKRYLAVTKGLDGFQLVPNADIDRFWHEHILDTRRYEQDCAVLFGHPLHHYPFFGMRGDADNRKWNQVTEFSQALWRRLFSENLFSPQPASPSRNEANEQESNNMTTININITIADGKPTLAVAEAPLEAAAQEIVEINGKKYVLTPAPLEHLKDAGAKCPQACPNEG